MKVQKAGTRRLKALTAVIGVAAGLVLSEAAISLAFVVKNGRGSRGSLIAIREQALDRVAEAESGAGRDRFENQLKLHPLFGYTYDAANEGVNNFGFKTPYDITFTRPGYSLEPSLSEPTLTVGIFGGSFAEFTGELQDYLEDKLRADFPGRRPVVVNMAIGGQAIPQSAFIYLYFQEVFDVAVFIDGLNEVWNAVQNNRAGVPPDYARATHYLYKTSRQTLSPSQLERTLEIIRLQKRLVTVSRLSLLPGVRRTLIAHYGWQVLRDRWSRSIDLKSVEITGEYQERRDFFPADPQEIMDHAAHEWRRYHRMVDVAARDRGALAVHLLQPNPFVPGSKALTSREARLVGSSYPVEPFVVGGYPLLRSSIRDIKSSGFVSADLTQLYARIEDDIWIDSAHPNARGVRLVLDEIARLIVRNRSRIRSPAPAPRIRDERITETLGS